MLNWTFFDLSAHCVFRKELVDAIFFNYLVILHIPTYLLIVSSSHTVCQKWKIYAVNNLCTWIWKLRNFLTTFFRFFFAFFLYFRPHCVKEEEEVFSSIEGLVCDALKDRLGMALFGHLDWNSFNHGKFSSWGAIYCNNMIYLHFKGTSLSKLLCCIPEFTLHMYVLYFLGTYFYLVRFLEDT